MIQILPASTADFSEIQSIAHRTWPVAYGEILLAAQLDYMLKRFYTAEALMENCASGQLFLLAKHNGQTAGFAAYELNYNRLKNAHLHKIYVLPEMHGMHIGLNLLEEIVKLAKSADQQSVSLNVNRFNKAIGFYEKIGFSIHESIDIEIGNGYLMEDYIMRKTI